MKALSEKRAEFRRLHKSGCFVMPNPWDVGSAVYLQSQGFKAIASSSAAFAWTKGKSDNAVTRAMVLAHLKDLAGAVDIPVNADFEGGFAHEPEGVAESVKMAVDTGVAGLSIEDYNGNTADPLYEIPQAVARIKAAKAAIDDTGLEVTLTARSEGFVFGRPDLAETIKRLKAYAEAGADCLFAPGIRTIDDILAVVRAVAPKPVNFVAAFPGFTVQQLSEMGVRRISVGGALARVAWNAFIDAAKGIAADGSFKAFEKAEPSSTMNKLFKG